MFFPICLNCLSDQITSIFRSKTGKKKEGEKEKERERERETETRYVCMSVVCLCVWNKGYRQLFERCQV